jgi:hypothetical protein
VGVLQMCSTTLDTNMKKVEPNDDDEIERESSGERGVLIFR